MELQVLVNGKNIAYTTFYPKPKEVLEAYKDLAPGHQIKFICDLINEINKDSFSICKGLMGNWANHSKEESDDSMNLLKKLIIEYENYKKEYEENENDIRTDQTKDQRARI